ncbi:MAG: radical SAM protein, partial [Woeseia sp.]
LAEWEKPAYTCVPITIGANTDPYQPVEREQRLTRRLLETFLRHRHPVSLISKGTLMRRDLDLLSELAADNLCSVAISIPTVDKHLKRIMEPRVPAAAARLRLLADLNAAGVPCTLLMAPIIPAINDSEIETIVARAADSGVQRAAWILLRLPHELRGIFSDWLHEHLPDRAAHVLSLLRQAHGGQDYDSRFGVRQTGRGPFAKMISQRFNAACRRAGIVYGESLQELDCSRFQKPGAQQLGLPFS